MQREEIATYQAAFDIAVQPQATPYASPLKLFEYMALGHAIVAPDQPNLKEVLTHNKTALLFNPHIAESFKSEVTRLVKDGALRRQLGCAAGAGSQRLHRIPGTAMLYALLSR